MAKKKDPTSKSTAVTGITPRNVPISAAMATFAGNWDALASDLTKTIRGAIAKGLPVKQAVSFAFLRHGVRGKLEDWYLEGIMDIVQVGGVDVIVQPKAFRKFWLNKVWAGQELSLSQRISKLNLRSNMINTISRNLKAASSWQKTAKAITDAQLVKADVAGHVWDLVKQGRRVFAGDVGATRAFEKVARKSQRQIERLARAGAPTSRLKKAYQNIITQVEKGSAEGLGKAIGRAVNAKARYNAERIARTEYARAYGEGFHADLQEDPDAVAYRSELGSRHPEHDICDYFAEADLFGLGPGTYPVDQGPPYPYHPNCICVLSKVFIKPKGAKERKKSDDKASKKWIGGRTKAQQKKLLGAKGADAFGRNPNTWKKNLQNYQGMKSTRPQTPDSLVRAVSE